MAYKEFTYYAQRSLGHQGFLEYELADTYNEAKNALEDNMGYNPGSKVGATIGQYYGLTKYFTYRGTLLFVLDSYTIGETIEYVAIMLKRYAGETLVTDFDVVVQNGLPDYPHEPVVIGDYDRSKYSGDGGSIKASDLVIDEYIALELNETGRGWVSTAGEKPKFILRSSRDIAGTSPVSNEERINYGTNNGSADDPKLVIRITLSIPNATAQEATETQPTETRFHGTITDKGGWLGSYGFEWKEGVGGSITSITVGGASQTVTTFDYLKTGLSPDTIYYFRAWGNNDAGKGYSEWVEVKTESGIINIEAVRDSTQSSIKLYGEIILASGDITEKGFEYLVQDEEPGAEDTGIEIIKTKPEYTEFWEIGEYWAYEYEGNEVDFWDRLYFLEENTIWWFRAYYKDDEENKYVADIWMKNVPTMTTFECTEVEAQQAKGNGEMTDKGANTVTRRGFRIIKEYEGDLLGLRYYDNVLGDYTLIGEIEMETLTGPGGTITGYIWRGTFYRDALFPKSQTPGDFEVGIYDNIIGGGTSGEAFGIYLKPNDTYKIIAIAVNQHGTGFGEEVDLATGQNILPSDDENVSEISAEKTITLGTIPEGETVTRIGIRLGRTEGCSEIHVWEDGEWGTGGSHTFYITGFVPGASYYKMPYIILDHGDYEEEILAIPDYRNPERREEWLEDYPLEIFPEVEDEDDLDQTVTDASIGDISYRTIIKEIKCEKIGEQSFIDRYGRRRSKTINNHLIQSRANCITIVDDYVEKFQILKLKVVIDYDIPIPFEREDVILLGDGKVKYREDTEGLIAFKADGEGEIEQQDFILTKIRKIDPRFVSGLETILSLELEV